MKTSLTTAPWPRAERLHHRGADRTVFVDLPAGPPRAEALFRLGECFRNQNQPANAERYYREVVDRHPKSDSSANAAYWLGVLSYNNKEFKAAATYFGFCEVRTTEPKVKLKLHSPRPSPLPW